jgi:hypothetical protein
MPDRPLSGRVFFEQMIHDNLDIGRPDKARYSRTCRQPQTGMIFRPVADVPGC